MSTTLWQLDEQTLGKHIVLRSYLDGWFPILGSWHGRLLFIDGFAGPGEYASGEAGSPLVALDCVRRHKTEGRLSGVEVVCVFIESDGKRARYLEGVVHSQPPIPKARAHVLTGTFDNHMTRILDQIEEQNKAMAPAFVMVDPFGIKGSPMALIERVLQNPRSECLISFMYEPIRRFHSLPEFEPHLNELFGTTTWQDCLQIQDEPSRKRFLHGLFQRQLKRHGAAYVVPFELWRGERHVYTIYFATGSLKGCDLMKACIWKIDPSGDFSFHGHAVNQLTLFGIDTKPLVQQLKGKFGNGWTSIKDIDDFVMSDETPFHKGHLRRKTLDPLEREGRIEVSRPVGIKGFANGKGIRLRFL